MKSSEIQFALNLEALSAPQCRRIVQALATQPLSTKQLEKACGLTPASIEKHLEPLFRSGLLVLTSVDGVEVLKLNRANLQPTIDWFADLIH